MPLRVQQPTSSSLRYLTVRLLQVPRATSTTAILTSSSSSPLSSPFRHPRLPPSPQPLSKRHFSNTANKMTSSSTFFDAVKARRTIYQLSAESTIPDSKIKEIVEQAVLHVPSSFNSQSTRVVVLLGPDHQKLWGDIVKPAVKAVAPAEAWPSSEQRLSGFQAGYGSVLFYEDPKVVAGLQEKFPLYADRFPQWSEHTNAMHQFAIWTALEQEGLGANLQHYNPLIDDKISATWNVPATWSLKAQLVFGKPTGGPADKAFGPLEERVFVHGAKN